VRLQSHEARRATAPFFRGHHAPPEQLRPVFDELASLAARKFAVTLNERKIVTPTGGVWHAATVIRVQKRLGLA